jgi:hypothetical protein
MGLSFINIYIGPASCALRHAGCASAAVCSTYDMPDLSVYATKEETSVQLNGLPMRLDLLSGGATMVGSKGKPVILDRGQPM